MATQYTAGLSAGQVLTASTMNSIGAAWESWTPTVSSETGTLTTTTVNAAKYCQINKLFIGEIDITINNAGTGGSFLRFTMPTGLNPTSLNNGSMVGYFREYQLVGFFGAIWISGTAGRLNMQKLDGTTPIATGNRVGGIFVCEIA
jgi:hypothetical protein